MSDRVLWPLLWLWEGLEMRSLGFCFLHDSMQPHAASKGLVCWMAMVLDDKRDYRGKGGGDMFWAHYEVFI